MNCQLHFCQLMPSVGRILKNQVDSDPRLLSSPPHITGLECHFFLGYLTKITKNELFQRHLSAATRNMSLTLKVKDPGQEGAKVSSFWSTCWDGEGG